MILSLDKDLARPITLMYSYTQTHTQRFKKLQPSILVLLFSLTTAAPRCD